MKSEDLKVRFKQARNMERVDITSTLSTQQQPLGQDLGLIDLLKGTTWTSPAQGWNLIALPFRDASAPFSYRLLMNQYSETLSFTFVDKGIPNRGITPDSDDITDQLIDGLDYQQVIHQVAADDSPSSNLRAPDKAGIHHEPGLFLNILNHQIEHEEELLSIARLASIPHGDSVMALGKLEKFEGAPTIPNLDALPLRVSGNVGTNPYLAPYNNYEINPFFGTVPASVPGFPGFFPTNANAILQFANPGVRVAKTVKLHFDTKFGTGGIVNIPFVVREANATEMEATFWIMELQSDDPTQPPEHIMQYSQTVFLDFFPSRDDPEQLIRWPHVSINTLRRV